MPWIKWETWNQNLSLDHTARYLLAQLVIGLSETWRIILSGKITMFWIIVEVVYI